jgi:hypothetical protein
MKIGVDHQHFRAGRLRQGACEIEAGDRLSLTRPRARDREHAQSVLAPAPLD